MSLLEEIKRRNVGRVAGLYLVGAWLIVQVASTVLPAFDLPGWALRAVITVLAIGFTPALIFAWVFELTPEGQKRGEGRRPHCVHPPHTGKSLDRTDHGRAGARSSATSRIDKFVLAPQREAALQHQNSEQVDAARKEGRSEAMVASFGDKSIAVLPFIDMSQGHD